MFVIPRRPHGRGGYKVESKNCQSLPDNKKQLLFLIGAYLPILLIFIYELVFHYGGHLAP
jgi:hypothetical protein